MFSWRPPLHVRAFALRSRIRPRSSRARASVHQRLDSPNLRMRWVPREKRLPELAHLHFVATLRVRLDSERERLGGEVAVHELEIATIERGQRQLCVVGVERPVRAVEKGELRNELLRGFGGHCCTHEGRRGGRRGGQRNPILHHRGRSERRRGGQRVAARSPWAQRRSLLERPSERRPSAIRLHGERRPPPPPPRYRARRSPPTLRRRRTSRGEPPSTRLRR